jgi:hypothetical protein
MSSKRFKSPRKLDSLVPGARVTFDSDVKSPYIKVWEKLDSGKWEEAGSSFSRMFPWKSASMIHYNNGRSFAILREGGEVTK